MARSPQHGMLGLRGERRGGLWRTPLSLALLLLLLAPGVVASSLEAEGGRRLLKKKPADAAAPAGEGAAAGPAAEAGGPSCCAQLPAGFTSSLPVVIISTQGAPLSAIPKPQLETGVKAKIPATACTCGSPDGKEFGGPVTLSERGSHTKDWDLVRSYSVGMKPSHSFVGMPKGGSWPLYGWENDTAGLHDWLGFQLYRATDDWASRTQYVELFLTNGTHPLAYPSDDYLGLYLAMQHIGQGKDLVPIKKDLAGDVGANTSYILDNEHGKIKQGLVELAPLPHSQIQYMLEYPTKSTKEQQDYILSYLTQFEGLLFGPGFADPAAGWRSLANQSSAINFFLFEELIKSNNNGYRGSQRLTKDADGPLLFGPPWDFNDGFGACCGFPIEGYQTGGQSNGSSGGSAISPQGWSFNICEQPERCKVDPIAGIALWIRRMWQDPAFQTATAQRFQQLRSGVWSDAAVSQQIASIGPVIHDAFVRAWQRWPVMALNPYAPPQPTADAQLQATLDKLSGWTTARLAWMNDQFATILAGSLAPAPPVPGAAPAAGPAPVSAFGDGGQAAGQGSGQSVALLSSP